MRYLVPEKFFCLATVATHVLDMELNTKFRDCLASELKWTSDAEQMSGKSHWWTLSSLRELPSTLAVPGCQQQPYLDLGQSMSSLAQRRKCPAHRHGPSTVTAAALTRVLSVFHHPVASSSGDSPDYAGPHSFYLCVDLLPYSILGNGILDSNWAVAVAAATVPNPTVHVAGAPAAPRLWQQPPYACYARHRACAAHRHGVTVAAATDPSPATPPRSETCRAPFAAVGSAERRPRTQLLRPNRPRTRGRAASESPEHRSRRGDSSYGPGPRLRADGRRPLRRRRLTLRGSLFRSWKSLCSGILTSNPPPAPVLQPRIVRTRRTRT
jgi:hypothetical protein